MLIIIIIILLMLCFCKKFTKASILNEQRKEEAIREMNLRSKDVEADSSDL